MYGFEILIIAGISVLVVLVLVFGFFILREVKKSRHFFDDLASRYGGRRTRFPFGMVLTLDQAGEVKISALQGAIIYKTNIQLREDPGALITRSYPAFRWLDPLNYSPGRMRMRFGAPIDEKYAFRTRNTGWIREIFTADLLEKLHSEGRVTRLEIRHKKLRGAMLMIWFSDEEQEKARQSIEILNSIVQRVVTSSLAVKPK